MVQVLDDLLAQEPSAVARGIVWLRVYSELPFSILYENSINPRSNGMAKLNKITNLTSHYSKRTIGVATGVLLVLIFVLAHGWIRNTALPSTVGMFYKKGVQAKLEAQEQALGLPFNTLLKGTPAKEYNCMTLATQSIHTQIDCEARKSHYAVLANVGNKQQVTETAAKIESTLKELGYQSGGNGVTLTSLVNGTYDGADYSPDAFYQIVSGPYNCIVDVNIAYANPAPAAISMNMWCARTINILGQPNNTTYDSNKGLGN